MKNFHITPINALAVLACLTVLGLQAGCSSLKDRPVAYYSGGNEPSVVSSTSPKGSQNTVGAAPAYTGQSTDGAASGAALTQLRQLTAAPEPALLAGRPVNLSGVPVQQVVGEHLIAVGSANDQPIYVRTFQPVSGIRVGQSVNLSGVVRRVPQSLANLNLDQASNVQLQNQPIYVDALSVTPVNQ